MAETIKCKATFENNEIVIRIGCVDDRKREQLQLLINTLPTRYEVRIKERKRRSIGARDDDANDDDDKSKEDAEKNSENRQPMETTPPPQKKSRATDCSNKSITNGNANGDDDEVGDNTADNATEVDGMTMEDYGDDNNDGEDDDANKNAENNIRNSQTDTSPTSPPQKSVEPLIARKSRQERRISIMCNDDDSGEDDESNTNNRNETIVVDTGHHQTNLIAKPPPKIRNRFCRQRGCLFVCKSNEEHLWVKHHNDIHGGFYFACKFEDCLATFKSRKELTEHIKSENKSIDASKAKLACHKCHCEIKVLINKSIEINQETKI